MALGTASTDPQLAAGDRSIEHHSNAMDAEISGLAEENTTPGDSGASSGDRQSHPQHAADDSIMQYSKSGMAIASADGNSGSKKPHQQRHKKAKPAASAEKSEASKKEARKGYRQRRQAKLKHREEAVAPPPQQQDPEEEGEEEENMPITLAESGQRQT